MVLIIFPRLIQSLAALDQWATLGYNILSKKLCFHLDLVNKCGSRTLNVIGWAWHLVLRLVSRVDTLLSWSQPRLAFKFSLG